MFIRLSPQGNFIDMHLSIIFAERATSDSPAIRNGTIAKLFKQPQFKEKASELSEADLKSLKADLENIVWYFHPEQLDFVGYACLAHYTQPGVRIAREAIIDGQFKHFFGSEMKTGLSACDQWLADMRSCLKTIPDAFLAVMAADKCQIVRRKFAGQLLDARGKGIAAFHAAFMQKAPLGGKLEGGLSEGHLLSALAYVLETPGEAQTFFKSLLALMEEKIGPAGMAPGMMFLKIAEAKLSAAIQRGFGYSIETVQAIIEAQAAPYGERQSILEKRFAEAFAKEQAMFIQAGHDTLRAVSAGANLCPSAMKEALEYVKRTYEVKDAIARSMMSLRRAGGASTQVGTTTTTSTTTTSTQGRGSGQTSTPGRGRVGGRGSAAQSSAMTASPADSTEAQQQLAGWSVDQWVRWIEGPPTRKTDQTTDPRKVASLLKAARSKNLDAEERLAKRAGQPASSESRTDTLFTAESVHQTLQAALRASADYFGDDIDETLLLGHSVIDPFDKRPLSELKEELEALKKPADIDEVQARALFGKIETAVLHVRAMAQEVERNKAALRKEEAELRRERAVCTRFATELQTALQMKSAVSIGKRTGGDILLRDPKPMDFWGSISRDYHGRYVPLSMILEGGVPRALDEDEALALYVTGGSKSGAAFCVSVHHWRRYPGSDAPPSAGAFEPMDHDHWYDTFNPCCVLHVRAS